MDQNNGPFDGHPTQAHADHAAIMKAHGIISDPTRMAAVHALHQEGGGLINFLKKKRDALNQKAPPAAEPPMAEKATPPKEPPTE